MALSSVCSVGAAFWVATESRDLRRVSLTPRHKIPADQLFAGGVSVFPWRVVMMSHQQGALVLCRIDDLGLDRVYVVPAWVVYVHT